MNSLRVRLTLWFALSFVGVTVAFMLVSYQHLDRDLRRKTFNREQTLGPDWIVRGSYAEEEVEQIMADHIHMSLSYSLPLMLAAIVLGYWLAKKSLSPIERLNLQLRAVDVADLGKRVSLPEADAQLRDLVQHLNEMLARLETSFAELGEYAARVAHELRTPLTIMALKVEQAEPVLGLELAEEMQGELRRLAHVVDQSLLIAKAGQGRLQWQSERFDLSMVTAEIVRDFHLLAHGEGRELELESQRDCWVQADPKYCRQVLHGLLTNALNHGRGGIRVRVRRKGNQVRLTLMNAVRQSPAHGALTLGLGLRVVRALLGQQLDIRFHQHAGKRVHATRIVFPCAAASS